jgi:alpha-amylase
MSTPPSNMTILQQQYNDISTYCPDTTLFGSFTENQDLVRFAHYTSDTSLLKSALTFALLADGIPIVYYGSEQKYAGAADPYNREALWGSKYNTSSPLYTALGAMNAARNAVAKNSDYSYWTPYWTWKTQFVQSSANMVVLRKGYDKSMVAVVTNLGQGAKLGPYVIGDTNFVEGDGVLDVLSCNTQTAGQFGEFGSGEVRGDGRADDV